MAASAWEPYQYPKNRFPQHPPLICAWNDSHNVKEDLSACSHPTPREIRRVELAPLLGTMTPSTSSPPAHLPTQSSGTQPVPPHLRVFSLKPGSIVDKEGITGMKGASSERPDDNVQLDLTPRKNEGRVLENRLIDFVPPHLRPAAPRASSDFENKTKTWIPPHLRKPEIAKTVEPHPKGSDSVGQLKHSNNESLAGTLSSVSVASKSANQTSSQDHSGGVNFDGPANQSLKPISQQPTKALQEESKNKMIMESVEVQSLKPVQPIAWSGDKSEPPASPPKACAANEPSPANLLSPFTLSQVPLYSRLEGIQFKDQKNSHSHGLPRTPPYYHPRTPQNSSRKGTPILNQSTSPPKHSQPFRSHDSGQFMLDHQEIRKRKSYTRYLAKFRHTPHKPRLPFEPVHRFYQDNAETSDDCSSTISIQPDEAYTSIAALIAIGIRESRRAEFTMPTHQEIQRHMELVTLESRQNQSNSDEVNEEKYGGQHGEYEEEKARHEYEDPGEAGDALESTIMSVNTGEQPSEKFADDSEENLRSIFLIGLPHNMTLRQISKICSGSGLIESIQISRENGIALVNFVVALVAKQFYEATKAKGVTLVFLDENKNTVKKQIIVKMDIQGTFVAQDVLDAVRIINGSRVLNILGWDRRSLENSAGVVGEHEVDLTDLLLRLTSQYVSRYFDTHHGEPKVQDVSWEVNQYGYLEATLIFSGIKDAMIVRRYMEDDHRLDGCFISYGKDPCTF